jgi:hypothetical protein
VSSVWENADNWNCGVAPDGNTDIIINSGVINFPILNSNTSVRSLTINKGASVTINPVNHLTIMQ